MNVQTFAEQIAVVQARHHEREKELLELLEEVLYWYNNYHRLIDIEPIIEKIKKEVVKELAEELADAVGSQDG